MTLRGRSVKLGTAIPADRMELEDVGVPEPGAGMNIQQISDHLEITALLYRYARAVEHLPMSQHYITNIEITPVTRATATVRAMFHNPIQLPRMTDLSVVREPSRRREHVRHPGAG
jgi:hypothetical protein